MMKKWCCFFNCNNMRTHEMANGQSKTLKVTLSFLKCSLLNEIKDYPKHTHNLPISSRGVAASGGK